MNQAHLSVRLKIRACDAKGVALKFATEERSKRFRIWRCMVKNKIENKNKCLFDFK
jgi:hypothetical protein